jgi:hypothetical protein
MNSLRKFPLLLGGVSPCRAFEHTYIACETSIRGRLGSLFARGK